MKKIISRYYFFVAILLVIAYQYFSGLVLHSDLLAGLSDFAFSCGSDYFYCYGLVREMATNQ